MKNKIKTTKLKQVLRLKRGYDLTNEEMNHNGKYPVIGSSGLIGYHDEYKNESPTITVGRSGSVGDVNITHEKCWAHNTTLFVEDYFGNNPYYIYYLLKNLNLRTFTSGSTVPTLNRNHLDYIPVVDFSLEQQNLIGSFLSSYDMLIKENDNFIKELNNFLDLVYNFWFTQFDFPDENGKPYKSSGGKMVWNEKLKREIPEGWEVKPLKEISKMYQPQTIPQKELRDDYEFPVYGAGGIIGHYHKINHEKPMLIISCRGSCGDVDITLPNSWITGNQMVIDAYDNFKYYIHGYLSVINTGGLITGTVQDQITQTSLGNLYIPAPTDDLLKRYNGIADNLLLKKQVLTLENEELTKQRDFLLPLLMNGQVTLK